jgi:hypothetical protein
LVRAFPLQKTRNSLQKRLAPDAPCAAPRPPALYYGLGHESQFVFEASEMQRISREAIAEGAGDVDAVVAATVRKLRETYPKCAPAARPGVARGGLRAGIAVCSCAAAGAAAERQRQR